MKKNLTIKDVKESVNFRRAVLGYPAAFILAYWIAPYISRYAIKKGIKPNNITILMIPCAVIASILFSMPNGICKILGAIGMHLFFALDLADGQVARFTKVFSQYGEQLDHLAHHCSHLFLVISIWISVYQMNRYPISFVYLMAGICLFVEYWYRDICAISTEIKLIRDGDNGNNDSNNNHINNSIIYV